MDEELERLDPALLQRRWRSVIGRPAPKSLSRQLMIRILLWREEIARLGDIDATVRAALAAALKGGEESSRNAAIMTTPRPGSVLVREHDGALHRVMVLDHGYAWNGRVFASLSSVARAIAGTNWNGRRFFGLDRKAESGGSDWTEPPTAARVRRRAASEAEQVRKPARCPSQANGPEARAP